MIVLDRLLTAIIYLILFYVLFFIGKLVHRLLHREYDLSVELVEKDNPAVAIALTGYYIGMVFAIGGAIVGPSYGLVMDMIYLGIYGLVGIVLLNISWFLCDLAILNRFKISDELIRDRNCGTAVISFGMSLASGLIIFGSMSGEGGGMLSALAFWAVGQFILVVAARVYAAIIPYDVHAEIEKDNVAAGVGFAGALIGIGIVVGLAAQHEFQSWAESLGAYVVIALAGLILLPAIRFLTDLVLIPNVKLTDEIASQETPNVGAAYIEAFSYIAASLVLLWCI
jgi:uncharacterized membrane protein YjfL (UPF0719 family)